MVERTASVIGSLEDWERDELEKSFQGTPESPVARELGLSCYRIADMKQTSTLRTMKWLKLSAEEGYENGMVDYAGLLHGLHPDLQYKGDEAAWWVKRVKDKWVLKNAGSFDYDGHRARRYLTRILLSGSLSKNQDSVLSRSFFSSGLREVHLLPLISKYLVGERGEEELEEDVPTDGIEIESLSDITSIVFCDTSDLSSLSFCFTFNNQYLCFLPLLFSHLPNLKELRFDKYETEWDTMIDLSFLKQVDTSKLESLEISNCPFDSLSPLSLCDLSSLHTLSISKLPHSEELHPLKGLSSNITSSLKMLQVSESDLKDLAPLSDCDLSSLEAISFESNQSLSDLSPFRNCSLPSLKYLSLHGTNVSDLSPLCDCKGLAPEELIITDTPIEDLSPLSLFNLSCLKGSIALYGTKVSDLSPLENVPYDGVEVDISDTPAAEKMREGGLDSPQTIGKAKVMWW